MNQNLTYIAILLDRSGSMNGSEKDVIGGVNTFLEQQRKLPGEALITIARFDSEYEVVYEDVSVAKARALTSEDFVPRGGTALADALGRLMTHVGSKLEAMKEKDRPGNVIMLVFSDGGENGSRETSLAEVKSRVKIQQDTFSWKFLFFGMDIDAVHGAAMLGMAGMNAVKGGGGILRGANMASAYVGYTRGGKQEIAESMLMSQHVDDASTVKATEDFAELLESISSDRQ